MPFFNLSFGLYINHSSFIPFLQCGVCTLQACFYGVLGASESMEMRLLRSSKHCISSQFLEEIYIIYLVVPKLLIFCFTASLKCYLGSTCKHNLSLLSISPVSHLHNSTEIRLVPILYCARWGKM